MRAQSLVLVLAVATAFGLAAAAWTGCGSGDAAPAPDAGAAGEGGAVACPPCVTDQDCNGGLCAQVGGDTYCAPTCPNGNECAEDRACAPVTTVTGAQASVCLPRADVCSAPPIEDAGPPIDTCGTLVGPSKPAGCSSCGANPCQANGCYGGWWCNTATNRCQAPPGTCDDEGGAPFDGGGPVTGTIGPNGGDLSRLLFAIVGDTRPANPNDTGAYPTAIIDKIYTNIQALPAHPPFVISSGDYNFASTTNGEAATQIALYMTARAKYSGAFFPAMGNHECTGATASNCGPSGVDGTTNNYSAFLAQMLGPISKTEPYYTINVKASDATWTAKFVFIAANAWSNAQSAWLETALAAPTTYTFVIRHEPADTTQAPGVGPSEAIMAQHPYTLSIVGHTHSYYHFSGREVLVGNGGAPLSGSKNYGFAIVSQRPDQALQIDMIDYASGLTDTKFHFVVKPNGSPTL
jgi:Calcineurin-like phosphoesterase